MAVGYLLGFMVLLVVLGWHPDASVSGAPVAAPTAAPLTAKP